ncbi:MAG: PTS sugar transporter subunit IIA [Phycisphaerae bacterium]|nr:PTS sugar transporter subunit IIA [Phycisphaerae bacterium]
MQLTDLLQLEYVKVPLVHATKREAIDELIDLLAERGRIGDVAAVREAVWERESTRTTGIGRGLAVPHGRTGGCEQLVIAVGLPAEPMDFDAVDGQPVQAIFLVVGPPDPTNQHIQVLARISRLMSRDDFRAALYAATDAQAVFDLIAGEQQVAT